MSSNVRFRHVRNVFREGYNCYDCSFFLHTLWITLWKSVNKIVNYRWNKVENCHNPNVRPKFHGEDAFFALAGILMQGEHLPSGRKSAFKSEII